MKLVDILENELHWTPPNRSIQLSRDTVEELVEKLRLLEAVVRSRRL